MAAARTLIDDPVFFRSTEAGSSGPLNIYPLLLPMLIGKMPTLFTGRVVGLFMIFGSLAMLHLYLRIFLSESLNRALVLFPAVFFALSSFWDFLHYTSELTPVFIISVGIVLVAHAGFSPPRSEALWVLYSTAAAAVLSLIPFAKLQAVYFALGIGLILVVSIVVQRQFTWSSRLKCLLVVAIGSLFLPAIFAMVMIHYGVFDYFMKSYVMNSIAYVESGHNLSRVVLLKQVVEKSPEFMVLFSGWGAGIVVTSIGLIIPPRAKLPVRLLSGVAFSLVLLALAAYTIAAPRRDWAHYLLFAPIILAIVLGMFVGCLAYRLSKPGPLVIIRKRSDLILCLLILISCCLPFLCYRLIKPNHFLGAAKIWNDLQRGPYSPIGKGISKAADRTNGKLAVWGYNPNYHTETGLRQATRLSISSAQFNENSLKLFFRQTYLDDLERNRPGVFVDATATNQFPALNDPERFRHELVPEVRDFVARNYRLVETIDGVRIYRIEEDGVE